MSPSPDSPGSSFTELPFNRDGSIDICKDDIQAPTVSPRDLTFLKSQGCFCVPNRSMLNEFMRRYFFYVHPLLPVLDEREFWAAYDADSDNEASHYLHRLSPLLLQAMLFASCSVSLTSVLSS